MSVAVPSSMLAGMINLVIDLYVRSYHKEAYIHTMKIFKCQLSDSSSFLLIFRAEYCPAFDNENEKVLPIL